MSVLNPAWLSDCLMERIIVHWSAGSYGVSDNDKDHYHFIIDQYGVAHRGHCPVSGNARDNPSGEKASHVKDLNTGSIGIAVAAMGDAIENPFDAGPWPITIEQWDALIVALAELCDFYMIPVDEQTLLMHGEVQEVLGVTQSGKWDIGRLPFAPDDFTNSHEVGDYMRSLVDGEMKGVPPAPQPEMITTTVLVQFTFFEGNCINVELLQSTKN